MLHVGNEKCQQEADAKTEEDPQRQGIYFAREESD
jgi:hypothetical protein